MSQLICPLCGKFASVRLYAPEDFEDDIKRVQVRSLGRGKGTERAWTVSIFEDEEDPIFFKLRDRIAVLYSLFFDVEDRSDEQDDLLYDINAALRSYYGDDAFDSLFDAAEALLAQFIDYKDEEEDEEDDDESLSELSELDKEILFLEQEEEEEEDNLDEEITL